MSLLKDKKAEQIPVYSGEAEPTVPQYWKSLDEFASSDEFSQMIHREFPEDASVLDNPISRRRFVQLMGSSMAFAGLTACRTPKEHILPYVKDPEGQLPGVANYYATSMSMAGQAWGVLAKSSSGRPTKIEGLKEHASSQGVANVYAQASILSLFNPERLTAPVLKGSRKNWSEYSDAWRKVYSEAKASRGKGMVLISELNPSQAFMRQKKAFQKIFPKATWLTHEPISWFSSYHQGKGSALSRSTLTYQLEAADVIVSFSEDFLGHHPQQISLTKAFAQRRKVEDTSEKMNRLYAIESSVSLTGTNADHRLACRPSEQLPLLQALAEKLGMPAGQAAGTLKLSEKQNQILGALAQDLLEHKGRSLVMVASKLGHEASELAKRINVFLKNWGNTVSESLAASNGALSVDEISRVLQAASNKDVKALIVLGANPVYTLPGAVDWGALFQKAEFSAVHGQFPSETSAMAQWQLPESHALESWGDLVSGNEYSLVQPIIEPLYDSRSLLEHLALLASGKLDAGFDLVKASWKQTHGGRGSDLDWKRTLRQGSEQIDRSSLLLVDDFYTQPDRSENINSESDPAADSASSADQYELEFSPSWATFDGRFANNAWLQETPDPVTKTVWGNPILIGPETAKKLGIETGRRIELSDANGVAVAAPVYVLPGQAEGVLGCVLGYGRRAPNSISDNVGSDFYPLFQGWGNPVKVGVGVSKQSDKVVTTQNHWSMEGRAIVRSASLAYFKAHPEFAQHMVEHPPLNSLWDEKKYDEGYQWGMTIDLNSCIGCTSCSIACQSENNIPVVGKEEVERGREMNWLRVDRYFEGEPEDPQFVHQPVMCQHCENAPCEQVCPVNATVHTEEGLNAMAYNRCIGTRYCSNNCPYKVRRFNFLDYTGDQTQVRQMANNPNVTVRSRGVMEKCTFCLQRINEKKRDAKVDGRMLKSEELQTACQQACPAGSIEFGNLLEKGSRVAKLKQSPRNYSVLGELNTKPRLTYLAKVRNLNPILSPEQQNEKHPAVEKETKPEGAH